MTLTALPQRKTISQLRVNLSVVAHETPSIEPIQSANVNAAYLPMKLADVRVTSGALHRETLTDCNDLVEGDTWSFAAIDRAVSTDVSKQSEQFSLRLEHGNAFGSGYLTTRYVLDLILMSKHGAVMNSTLVEVGGHRQSYLLLPATLDPNLPYELIATTAAA